MSVSIWHPLSSYVVTLSLQPCQPATQCLLKCSTGREAFVVSIIALTVHSPAKSNSAGVQQNCESLPFYVVTISEQGPEAAK